MRVLIIGATHGNELLGIRLYQRLLLQKSPLLEYINFIVGNPRALAAKQRYIDCDLNRSYTTDGELYEQQRAKEIREYIRATKPDLILDMHTTACNQPNCIIVPNTEGSMRLRLLAASHITHVLQVKPMGDIAEIADNVVGYEVPNRNITAKLLDAITLDIQNFIEGKKSSTAKQIYEMTDKIYKTDVRMSDAKTFVNFEMHPLGFIPIMTGNNSYKKQTDYLGFQSAVPKDLVL